MTVRSLLLLAAIATLAGCNESPALVDLPPSHDLDVVVVGPAGSPVPPGTRARRRMNLDQLDAAIRTVTGGIGWTAGVHPTDTNRFEELAATLGKPDYAKITREDLSPSATFQKFLGDAARSVCDELLEVERTRPPARRVFLIHAAPEQTTETAPEAIDRNLGALLLRYHGVFTEPGSSKLMGWRGLFDASLQASGDPIEAWRAVCVALISHPSFYTY